ncbi:hypothetical protein OIU78_000450 [Salix suchowensis]|nr:hypothetical protein OIU78_000450 [Salix suchowensis]
MLKRSEKKRVVASGDGAADVIKSQLAGTGILDPARNRLHLDYSVDGKVAAVACVTFSIFGMKGKLIISGGNDKLISESVGLLQIS